MDNATDATELDPLDAVTLQQLQQKHPEWQQWELIWQSIRLMFRGGEEFLLAAGTQTVTRAGSSQTSAAASVVDIMTEKGRRRRFLFQLEGEPDVKYIALWERAFYINYFAAIINYFRHWLFSQQPSIRPAVEPEATEIPEAPRWWSKFGPNCTGGGKSFFDFIKDCFLETMLLRRSGWLIGRPTPPPGTELEPEGQFVSQALAEKLGLDRSLLSPYAGDEIVDWQEDAAGDLLWVVLRKKTRVRIFPNPRLEIDVYTYADRREWRSWYVQKQREGAAGDSLIPLGGGTHGLDEVPFVMFELPHDLWIANQIFSLCVDIFNRQNRLHYSQHLAMYSQFTLTSNDGEAESRIMGDGIILRLRAGDGVQPAETATWLAPPTGPYDFIAASIKDTVGELYRAVHQLSLAVDSQAVTAVARSGASKAEDHKSIEVILAAFGGYVRQAIVRTLNLVSSVQGDGTEWTCEGFDEFDVSSLQEELTSYALVQTLAIHSNTAQREIEKAFLTGRLLNHIDPATKVRILAEVDDFYDQQAEAGEVRPIPPPTPAAPPGGAPPDSGGEDYPPQE